VVFGELLATRQTRLLRAAVLLMGDVGRGEDALQSALVRTWAAKPAVDGVAALEAYVRRALVTGSASHWRGRFRERAFLAARRPAAVGPDPVAEVVARDELVRALRELPARARTVVVLRYYLDLSETETAEALGISVGTVKSQASRALAKLREQLAKTTETVLEGQA
jgi:RNA polymerase sigma-70 factor (sigma-E family)